ncbi:MAG: F0F1 ATP synthase subunit A [Candidatus Izemoplasmataceae bacterium]
MLDFYIGLSASLKSSLVIVLVLSVVLVVLGQKVKKMKYTDIPSGFVLLSINFVELVNNMMTDYFRKYWKVFTPYLFTVFLFLIVANTASLWGIATPLSNISVALAFSIFAFLSIQIAALVIKRPKQRLKDLSDPHPLFLPMNLVSEMSTPFAMGLRLFGNLLSGAIFGLIVYGLTSWAGVIPGALILHPIFDVFFGVIQAYVYLILFTIFLSMAVEE